MALGVDAIYGNYQERLMKKHPHFTNADIAYYAYSFGALMLLVGLIGKSYDFDNSLYLISVDNYHCYFKTLVDYKNPTLILSFLNICDFE